MKSILAKHTNRGFTLIELLVVIAIIAILAAILFPVFARARENARRASCQSNEKNIALGFKQYIQDNGEKYPPGGPIAGNALKTSGGSGALSEYIKSEAIFICPSDSIKTGSYGYVLENAPNESAIENTTTTPLLKETSASRHFDGQNIAFVDGHVKWGKGTPPYNTASDSVSFGATEFPVTGGVVSLTGLSANQTSGGGFKSGSLVADPGIADLGVPEHYNTYRIATNNSSPNPVTVTTATFNGGNAGGNADSLTIPVGAGFLTWSGKPNSRIDGNTTYTTVITINGKTVTYKLK